MDIFRVNYEINSEKLDLIQIIKKTFNKEKVSNKEVFDFLIAFFKKYKDVEIEDETKIESLNQIVSQEFEKIWGEIKELKKGKPLSNITSSVEEKDCKNSFGRNIDENKDPYGDDRFEVPRFLRHAMAEAPLQSKELQKDADSIGVARSTLSRFKNCPDLIPFYTSLPSKERESFRNEHRAFLKTVKVTQKA